MMYNFFLEKRRTYMDVKEALKKGTSAEELRKDFDAELAKAQEELEKENQRDTDLKTKRETFLGALEDYFKAVGVFSEDDAKYVKKTLNKWLKDDFEKKDPKILYSHPHNDDWWNQWLKFFNFWF